MDWLHEHPASFDTPATRAAQDEVEFFRHPRLMPFAFFPHPELVEGRRIDMQR
jgi:hypothetical protein